MHKFSATQEKRKDIHFIFVSLKYIAVEVLENKNRIYDNEILNVK